MARVRLTNQVLKPFRTLGKSAKMYDNADPGSMNNPFNNPDSEKYEGEFEDEEQSSDTPWRKDQSGYDEDSHFMLSLEDEDGRAATAARVNAQRDKKIMAQKAVCCIKLAKAMMPHAVDELIDAQASSLMLLPHTAVIASMKRLDIYNADPAKAASLVKKIKASTYKTADEDEEEASEEADDMEDMEADEDMEAEEADMEMESDEPEMEISEDYGDMEDAVEGLNEQIQDAQDDLDELDGSLEDIEDALADLSGGAEGDEDDLDKEIIAAMNNKGMDYSASVENDIDFTQDPHVASYDTASDSRLEQLFMNAGLEGESEGGYQPSRLRKSASVQQTGKKKIQNLRLSQTLGKQVPKTKSASRQQQTVGLSDLWESSPDVSEAFAK